MSHAVQVLAEGVKPTFGLSAEEFYATCKLKRAELIDGVVFETPIHDSQHGSIRANIACALLEFSQLKAIGRASFSGGFRLQHRPDTVLSPDICFMTHERLAGQNTESFIEGAPDLAVEVNSPNDKEAEIEAKVQLYFQAGTRAVWIVEPLTRTITVRTPDSAPVVYRGEEILRGEPVLPGFEMPLSEVFDF